MKTETLIAWLKRGYGSFKEGSGLPEWVLPARGFSEVVDEMGDNGILEMSRPVKMSPIMKKQTENLPPDTVSTEDFQNAARSWELISQVKPVVEACFDTRVILNSFKEDERKVKADVLRSICVLAVAPFSPEGETLLAELASILGSDKECPGDLIGRYVSAVIQNELATLNQVSDCIKGHRQWRRWSTLFARKAMSLKGEPKLIGVTPPVSADIVWLLAQMMKEGWEDGSSGDYPGCPSG